MNITVRTADLNTDLEALAAITSWADQTPSSPEDMRRYLAHLPPGRITCRLVAADEDDRVQGYALAVHEKWSPAGFFYIWVGVNEDSRHKGIGTALRDGLWAFLKENQVSRLASDVWDNDPVSLKFAEYNGFSIDRHLFKSCLGLASFDETPFSGVIEKLTSEGITFTSLAELGDDEFIRRKYHELDEAVSMDIPGFDEIFMDFEEYNLRAFHTDFYRPAGRLVALDGERWVGFASVNILPATGNADNEMTGVRREYRGHGIALAIKLLAIRFAKVAGAREITTSNDSLNAPMLAVNRKLGYQPQKGQYKLKNDHPGLYNL